MNINDFTADKMYRMCIKKKRYKNELQAKEASEKYGKMYNVEYQIYYCRLCGKYHLTTKNYEV